MRKRLVAAFALIAIALAGCSGSTSGSPSVQPTSTASVRTSPTQPDSSVPNLSPSVPTTGPNVRPGEKPPILPEAAKRRTPVGAAIFGAFWFRTWDWAYATTDSTLMAEYFTSSCTDCRAAARQFVEFSQQHKHFVGGRLKFQGTRVVRTDRRHHAQFAVDVTEGQTALRVLNASNHVVEKAPAVKSITFRLYLRWDAGAWSIVYKAHVV